MNTRSATLNDLENFKKLSDEMMKLHCSFDPYYGIYLEYEDDIDFYKEDIGKKDRLYLVAENENGELVGYSSAKIKRISNETAPVVGILISVFVLEDYRNHGIGTGFYNKIMEWFKENNVKHIELSVDTHNEPALNLWKKLGFKDYQLVFKMDL